MNLSNVDRMPPLPSDKLDEHQRAVAKALTEGPRGGVKGPFIALLRSPALVEHVGKLGEYLRFGSSLEARIGELVMVIVAREWSNAFEWGVHVPLARKAGVAQEAIDAIAEGRRPAGMREDEAIAHAVCEELSRTKGVSDATYREAVSRFGERGLVELLSVYGYFAMVCAVMNVAHTPPGAGAEPLRPFPP
jgi:4-carboxymuconolactone decarboxylase